MSQSVSTTVHKGWVLATVCAAVLAINLDTTIVNVALPSISRELSAGTRQLQWVVDAYNLAFAGLVLAAGSLSDRFGRRPALITGLLGFAAASAVGALVTSADALVAARFLMGAFAALIFPTTLSIISNTFRERRERAAALGIWGAVVGVGVAAGPITGGVLLEHFYWGSVFWALVPLAVVTAGAAYLLVPESRDRTVPPLDLPGLGLSVAMLVSLTYTIIEAPAHGWSSVATLGGFAAAAVLLVAFVVRERRTPHPMLDVSLFRDRRFSAASGAVTVTFFALFGFIFLVTQYFQFVRGFGTLSTGARILPGGVVDRGRLGGRRRAGAAHRYQDRGDDRDGAVRIGVPVDLDLERHDAVHHGDRAADGDDGPGHGADLDPGHRVDPAGAPTGPGRCRIRGQRRDAGARRDPGRGRRRLDLLLGVRGTPGVGRLRCVARIRGHRAQDSVGVAQSVAGRDPQLVAAFHDSFMSAMSTSCIVVGLLCLAGAVAAAFLLPGRLPTPIETAVDEPEPVAA